LPQIVELWAAGSQLLRRVFLRSERKPSVMRLFEGTPWDRPPHCERCGLPETDCQCPPVVAEPERIPPGKQTARLAVEKRKKGKLVTVIRGLPAEGNDLPGLLTRLKNQCGAGGTLAGDEIEIQGDHLARLREILEGIGYKVRG
jgi:translation initiation factor 1